jgi:hypothetical protein
MPGYYDCLHSGETSWKSCHDGRCGVMAMHDVRARTPKRSVQAAHQMKEGGRMVENNFKAFGPQLFA